MGLGLSQGSVDKLVAVLTETAEQLEALRDRCDHLEFRCLLLETELEEAQATRVTAQIGFSKTQQSQLARLATNAFANTSYDIRTQQNGAFNTNPFAAWKT